MSLWILAEIGAMNFHFTPLVITVLVLSLAWTAEVMRNIVNLTVSRVIALYYLRGMQSIPQNCFQRAFTQNLGSACLGSLFVPTIEALRVVVRGLNLLEGEDEFMFSCAHCCLNVMQSIFRYGNGWAFVQVISLLKLHPNKIYLPFAGFLVRNPKMGALLELKHILLSGIAGKSVLKSYCLVHEHFFVAFF
jgi:hypothetical protein